MKQTSEPPPWLKYNPYELFDFVWKRLRQSTIVAAKLAVAHASNQV